MPLTPENLRCPHTVTFDCWATLLYEREATDAPRQRARLLAEFAAVSQGDAEAALRLAWREHQTLWHQRTVFDGVDMTRFALQKLGVDLDAAHEAELVAALESEILGHTVHAVEGAREALGLFARTGVRTALICDTGFTPGRVVRQLLQRVGLLEYLEVTVFSNEVGVPKPDRRAFSAALDALRVDPAGAVHVGDLRRSDIAGARAALMGSVRLRARHDDAAVSSANNAGVIDCAAAGCDPECEHPEADAVVDSYLQLRTLFGFD
jgi:putative hydrolase of the HAD superfamily